MMERRWGRIITISSNVAKAAVRDMGPHSTASKAGLVGLVRSLALQLAPYNITVNDVAPGPTNTDNSLKWTPEQLAASAERIPLGRRGEPTDIAGAIVFLASEAASWITGASLDINGGIAMG
jgi:3-oxoacyl-[acyl-carrier protein] reductase